MNVEDGLHCLEVCGGRGVGGQAFSRPGLDVWIERQADAQVAAGGGEVYFASSCASGRITRLLLADISGNASVFHRMAADLRDVLKRNVNSMRQARCVRELTRELHAAADAGGFASTLIGTYFAPTRSFTLCNAGHPPPLLYRAATQQWSLLQAPAGDSSSDAPPGVLPEGEYQHLRTRLETDDCVVLYSNTLVERSTNQGNYRGLHGFSRLVEQHAKLPPSRLAKALLNDHADPQAEVDATVIVCRATNKGVRWQDNLLAPLRLIQPVSDQTGLSL